MSFSVKSCTLFMGDSFPGPCITSQGVLAAGMRLRNISHPCLLAAFLAACSPGPSAPVVKPTPAPQPAAAPPGEADARAFLDQAETELRRQWSHDERVKFVENTDVTHDTEVLSSEAEKETMDVISRLAQQGRRFDGAALPAEMKRKLWLLRIAQTLPAP